MASLNRRKKATAEVTAQDLLLALAKAVGTDHAQEYNPDTFSSMWVDLYNEGDEESYQEQGAYIHNLLQQLYVTLNTRDTTAIVAQERKTKVWYQHTLELVDRTDKELVDDLLDTYGALFKPISTDEGDLAFIAVEVVND